MDSSTTTTAPAAVPTADPTPPANRSVRQRAQLTQAHRQQQAAPPSAPASAVPPTPSPSEPGAARSDAPVPAGTVPAIAPPAAPPAIADPLTPPAQGGATPPTDLDPAPAGDDGELLDPEPNLLDDAAAPDDLGNANGRPQWVQELLDDPDIPKVKKTLLTRIHSLVDERDAERNARLELERAQAQATVAPANQPQAGPAGTGLEAHPNVRAIDGQLSQVLSGLEILERHPEGGELTRLDGQPLLDANQRPLQMTPDEVRHARLKYNADLSRLNAERATTVMALGQDRSAREAEANRTARASYPWLNDRQSAEYQTAVTVLREFPGVKANPEWPLVVGRYVTGLMAERAAAARTMPPRPAPMTRPKGGNTPAPVAAQRSVVAPPADPVATELAEARDSYRKAPTVKNRAKLFALQRQQSTAA